VCLTVVVLALCLVLVLVLQPKSVSASDSALIFQDNFDSLTLGAISGQNGWVSYGGDNWVVQTGSGGRELKETTGNSYEAPLYQTNYLPLNVLESVDFKSGTGSVEMWARETAPLGGFPGYQLIEDPNSQHVYFFNYKGDGSFVVLASTSFSHVANAWYTAEFQVANNANGEPVLTAWIYTKGSSRPGTPTLTYTDTAKWHVTGGYTGLGSWNSSIVYDNFTVSYGGSLPSAPTNLQVTPHNSKLSLTWGLPLYTNNAAITDYVVRYKTGTGSFQTSVHVPSAATGASITGLAGSTTYTLQVAAVNASGTGDTITGTGTTMSKNLTITTPPRAVTGAPSVATLSFHRDCNQAIDTVYTIPYIQTSSGLTITTTYDADAVPAGGGLKYVLDQGQTGATIQYDQHASPSTVTFQNVPKGDHTMDVYIVDSSHVVQSGSSFHDQEIHIGIGDIYVAVGDSVTEGYYGVMTSASPYTNWLNAPLASNDNRNFALCVLSSADTQMQGQFIELNNALETALGYPVFILNEGLSNMSASLYRTNRMLTASFESQVSTVIPNKWLIHLGINDFLDSSSTYQADVQTLINIIDSSYVAKEIDIAVPPVATGYASYVTNLISGNANAARGPNFYSFYINHPEMLHDVYHPLANGQSRMGHLWAISILSPQNVVVSSQSGSALALHWRDLSVAEPSIARYKVKYGESPGTYTTTVDVGAVTSYTIHGLSPGHTYYTAVSAYDNDAFTVSETRNSSELTVAIPASATSSTAASSSSSPAPSVGGGYRGGHRGGASFFAQPRSSSASTSSATNALTVKDRIALRKKERSKARASHTTGLDVARPSIPAIPPTLSPSPSSAYWSVAADSLRMRDSPSVTASQLHVLAFGTKFTMLGLVSPSWAHIRLLDGTEGYVSTKWLRKPRS
jgi:hypothetical protein